MLNLENLRESVMAQTGAPPVPFSRDLFMAQGYAAAYDQPNVLARAKALEALLTRHEKVIYPADRIAGSLRGLFPAGRTQAERSWAQGVVDSYGQREFITNFDHFAPDYETALHLGIPGMLERIRGSLALHAGEEKKRRFLEAAAICMEAFRCMVEQYAGAARARTDCPEAAVIEETCRALTQKPPETFRQALQLVWLIHVSLVCEGRYAMALGRIDQYLYPFYERDIREGRLTREEAVDLLACTFIKIGEYRLKGADDVVNIAIAGVRRDGGGGLNPLSYDVLEAVRRCNIPGPNLTARLYRGIADDFLDACLLVIGTGLGYPALSNDDVNIPALARFGYALEDCRDYCFAGCIENFIQGKQPPWSDGRFNVPKYVELAVNDGVCMLTGEQLGPRTGSAESFAGMDAFMKAVEAQIEAGAAQYMSAFRNANDRLNRENYMQPYLSCYCRDCIGRGLDINDGGALYPSAHGAGCMGIATVADSLAAIHRVVYREKQADLPKLREAMKADYRGYEELRGRLLAAPKYGNDQDEADEYAVWYVRFLDEVFRRYRTPDGGPVYTAIASNVSNIPAGEEIAASPDGRLSRQPLSDAASPTYGRDKAGPTAVVNSLSKPDYTKVSTGTVVNQKFSPSMFTDPEKRAKLRALVRVYFERGGQEMQFNAISRELLKKAMDKPEAYGGLVVRVSGFSAYYTELSRAVQEDILRRTEHQ